jgi:homoserine O-acetyltransferase
MYKILRKKRIGDIVEELKGETVGLVSTAITQVFPDGLRLESGEILPGPIDVAYETYGNLNEDKSNVILVCHALSGSAHAAGYHRMVDDETFDGATEGWWEDVIGPGKGIDTNKYFVICSNFLGSCYGTTGPTSINPKTGKRYGITFPTITISDMVKVQRELIKQLGIEKLLAVVGGSMGGMQALEWSVMYPEIVESVIAIAATANCSAQNIAFDAVGRNAIISDPNWGNGEYLEKGKVPSKGLSIARMIGHITYLSEKSMDLKFGRRFINGKTYDVDDIEFEVESYLGYQGEKFVNRFDANSYLYITKAMDYFDLPEKYGNGDLKEVFKKIRSKLLFISFTSDWLFPPSESLEMVSAALAAGKNVSYINIESINGHDSFLIDTKIESETMKAFLNSTFLGAQKGEKVYGES